jgi:peptidoglycan/xylan/chitin deacetylase (PgdA/CDA1 family)
MSFDDGDPADARVAELLTEHGMRATFYASTGPTGARLIHDDALRSIAEHHELGNHGRTHRLFVDLSPEELADEVRWGQEELARFGQAPRLVAPPKGRITGAVVERLSGLGLGVRTAPILGTGGRRANLLDPTFLFYPHGSAALARNTLRRRRLPMVSLLLAWAGGRDYRRRTHRLLETAARRAPCVHVWGHAEEIERLGLWAEFEDLLLLARRLQLVPATNGDAYALLSERSARS